MTDYSKFEMHFDKYNVNTRNPADKEYFSAVLKIANLEYGLLVNEIVD